MTLAAALLMPLVMLGLLFFLARIEERHLTVRTRVRERHDVVAATEVRPGRHRR